MLIFDCDGVLVDSEAIYVDAELRFLADAGVRYERAAYVRHFMGLAPDDWRRELRVDFTTRLGRPLPPDFFSELDAAVVSALEAGLTAVPGARDAVAAADRRCVASSTALPRLRWKLRHTGLADLFGTHVFSADAVGHGKPAPDLFLHAAEQTGAAADTCTVVEDSVNGVRAGRAAGMRVIGFTGGGHCGDGHGAMLLDAGAHAVVADFADLHATIAALGG